MGLVRQVKEVDEVLKNNWDGTWIEPINHGENI